MEVHSSCKRGVAGSNPARGSVGRRQVGCLMVFEATVGLSRQVVTLVFRKELVGSIPIDHPKLYRDGPTVQDGGP